MPFPRPPLTSLITRVRQSIQAELPGSDPTLRRSFLRALANAGAALSHGQYGAQQWTANQILIAYCDADTLADQAQIYQLPQKDGSQAGGNMVVSGTNGTVIAADTEVVASNGALYTTTGPVTVAGGTATLALEAEAVGADGNQDSGAVLTFTSPLAGVNATGAVGGSGLTGGADVESIEAWRERLMQRVGNPPGRWLAQDYVDLALTMPGVTRAWAFPNELAPGMVSLRFVMDDGTGSPTILPNSGAVTTMQTLLTANTPLFGPATAVAPLADAVNFNLTGIPVAYESAVEAELAALFSEATGSGATLPLEEIADAINQAVPAGTDWNMSSPNADVVPASNGYLPVLGTVTF